MLRFEIRKVEPVSDPAQVAAEYEGWADTSLTRASAELSPPDAG